MRTGGGVIDRRNTLICFGIIMFLLLGLWWIAPKKKNYTKLWYKVNYLMELHNEKNYDTSRHSLQGGE